MPTQQPRLSPQAEADKAARLAREAEALRENLRRRKEQARQKQQLVAASPSKTGTEPCP